MGLIAVRSLMGLVNAPLHPAAARMVFAHVPTKAKSLANGLVTFAACAGISATYYGFGALIDRLSWPSAFFVTGMDDAGRGVVLDVGHAEVFLRSSKPGES